MKLEELISENPRAAADAIGLGEIEPFVTFAIGLMGSAPQNLYVAFVYDETQDTGVARLYDFMPKVGKIFNHLIISQKKPLLFSNFVDSPKEYIDRLSLYGAELMYHAPGNRKNDALWILKL